MEWLDWLLRFLDSAIRVTNEYLIPIVFFGLFIVLLLFTRRWPDRAVLVFLRYGLRATPEMERQLRVEFAEMTSKRGRQALHTIMTQQAILESLRNEIKLVKTHVSKSPSLVKEVGKALVGIEKEYEQNLKKVNSESAKDVLLQTRDKAISDVLQVVNHSPPRTS